MKTQRGFTVVELLIVMSITLILLGLATINLVHSQQLKSMIGDTEGRLTQDSYGIHFDSNRYVLFHGTYSAGDTSNFVVNLDSNMQFNNPGFDVIFSRLSGEITAPTAIELQDNTNSKLERIHLNTLGTVTQVESL